MNGIQKKAYRLFDLLLNAPLKRIDKFLFRIPYRSTTLRKYKEKLLSAAVQKQDADIFIAVDIMPLSVVQKIKGAAHFLSLELIPDDPYMKKIDTGLILSVIIQNEYRYRYLFGDLHLPVFYIQNSPLSAQKVINTGGRAGLLWAGTVVKEFAVLDCFEFIKQYPQYRLVCKGAVEKRTAEIIKDKYKDLLEETKIVINDQYLESNEFLRFISRHRIGFCFYDLGLIKKNFNYATAPSGKLFMYLAAGVPVIASNIPGFKFIKDYGAGILIDDYGTQTIYEAIQAIEANFNSYSANAYKAFDANAFDIHLPQLVKFIDKS